MSASSPASTTDTSALILNSASTFCRLRRTAAGSCALCTTVCTRSLQPAHVLWRSSRCAIISRRPPSCNTHHTSTKPSTRSSRDGNASSPTHSSSAFSAAVHSHTVSTRISASLKRSSSSASRASSSSSTSSSSSSVTSRCRCRRGHPSSTVLGSSPPKPKPCMAKDLPSRKLFATTTCAKPRTPLASIRPSSASRAAVTLAESPRSRAKLPSATSATTHSPRPFLS
mmetsp:Transcript_15119/g.36569  ORF Transcript_15119/g.36569 Transcript_15119/m.36569 type:complete len:227 (-) Transcript_15119:964-1644(-)